MRLKLAPIVFRFYIGLAFLYIFAPVLSLMLVSVQTTTSQSLPVHGFTLSWYHKALANPDLLEGFRTSLLVALTVAPVSVALGFASAHVLCRRLSSSPLLYACFVSLPAFIPSVLSGLALLIYFQKIHFFGSVLAVVVAHVCYCSPFAFVIIFVSYQMLDPELDRAARNLGANEFQVLARVVIPQLTRPLFAAGAISALMSWDEFTLAWFVGGFTKTLPTVIYGLLGTSFDPSLNAAGTVATLFSITCLLVAAALLRRSWRRPLGAA